MYYTVQTMFTDIQYMYLDFGLSLPILFIAGYMQPIRKLSKLRP